MMNAPPPITTFVSRRLSGVLRQGALGRPASERGAAPRGGGEPTVPPEFDTQAYEALYYRARLILGESLSRPLRF